MKKTHEEYLHRAIAVSRDAVTHGNLPFGAILVDSQGHILMEQENVSYTERRCTGHAETSLAERASHMYDRNFLRGCTLYATAEPCCMCSGAIYWANIGIVVYAMSAHCLLELIGNNAENPTLDLPCRNVFAKGQKEIAVIGPFPELEEDVAAVHQGIW